MGVIQICIESEGVCEQKRESTGLYIKISIQKFGYVSSCFIIVYDILEKESKTNRKKLIFEL